MSADRTDFIFFRDSDTTYCVPAACVRMFATGQNSERRDKYIEHTPDQGTTLAVGGVYSAPSPSIVSTLSSSRPLFCICDRNGTVGQAR